MNRLIAVWAVGLFALVLIGSSMFVYPTKADGGQQPFKIIPNAFGNVPLKVDWSFFDNSFSYEKTFNNQTSDYELEIEFQKDGRDYGKYKYKIKTDDEGYYGLDIIFNPYCGNTDFFESNYTFVSYYQDGSIEYNFTDIVRQYPELYVGIYDKKVIASGKTISEVEEKAKQEIGDSEFPIFFAEKEIHVY